MSSTWTLEFESAALKALKKLDKPVAQKILRYLQIRVLQSEDPRRLGKALRGELAEYWRYRVGDFRVVCQIVDHRLVVLVVRLAHRRDVYE